MLLGEERRGRRQRIVHPDHLFISHASATQKVVSYLVSSVTNTCTVLYSFLARAPCWDHAADGKLTRLNSGISLLLLLLLMLLLLLLL